MYQRFINNHSRFVINKNDNKGKINIKTTTIFIKVQKMNLYIQFRLYPQIVFVMLWLRTIVSTFSPMITDILWTPVVGRNMKKHHPLTCVIYEWSTTHLIPQVSMRGGDSYVWPYKYLTIPWITVLCHYHWYGVVSYGILWSLVMIPIFSVVPPYPLSRRRESMGSVSDTPLRVLGIMNVPSSLFIVTFHQNEKEGHPESRHSVETTILIRGILLSKASVLTVEVRDS